MENVKRLSLATDDSSNKGFAQPQTFDANFDRILGIKEASEFLGVSRFWLYEKSRPGNSILPSFRLGKFRKFRMSDLLKFIDGLNSQQQ